MMKRISNEKYNLSDNNNAIFWSSCKNNSLKTAQWILKKYRMTDEIFNETYDEMYDGRYDPIFSDLYDTCITLCRKDNNFEMIEWLSVVFKNRFGRFIKELFHKSCLYGNIKTTEFLYEQMFRMYLCWMSYQYSRRYARRDIAILQYGLTKKQDI